MSHSNLKRLLAAAGSLLPFLSPLYTAYAEDAYFDISFDRCVNIEQQDDKSKLSDIGDSVTVNPKGRLWLTGNETKESLVEIVCQNLSNAPVTIEMNSNELPWIRINGAVQCSDWDKNILICAVAEKKKGFFCKINEKYVAAAGDGSKKQASASVNVRSVDIQEDQAGDMNEMQYLQKRIEYYATGIDLCCTMHTRTDQVVISWIIYDGGAVDKVTVDSQTLPENNEFADCIAEQIPTWKFPEWKKDSQVSYQF